MTATETIFSEPHRSRAVFFVDDVEKITGFSRATVWNWLKNGDLPSHNIGKRRVIRRDDLAAFLSGERRATTKGGI
jgi:excisionase family DNA binding protein